MLHGELLSHLALQNYYVADFVWATSGVIATVTAGIVLKLLGRALVNDLKLLEDFLTILEHILNTILFTLGGAVWGSVIALGEKSGVWGAKEWGYLIVLYLLLNVIRSFLFTAIYPITVRIGIKTNWQETAFQIFSGLRGALGIALAIALDNRVAEATGGQDETQPEIHTQQALACIGK
jgi:NhaP-type Na+/H+ or K+/H+ antiporter